MSACCPPGSHAYLDAGYAAKGTVVRTAVDGFEIYEAPVKGTPRAGLVLCPDVWGWNGGRTRAVADALAEELGVRVVVGKFLADKTVDGGTDGDGLGPTADFSLDWIKNYPYEKQKSKVDAAVQHMQAHGVERIGVVGFCYGGHIACSAACSADWKDYIKCGVVLHPSMQLEDFAFGGDCKKMLSSVCCPFYLMPAGNDLPMWAEDGEYCTAFKASAKGFQFKPYPEMVHGWSVRGELTDPAVSRDVESAMRELADFVSKHLELPSSA